MRRPSLAALFPSLLALLLFFPAASGQELSEGNYTRVRDFILPRAEELRWQAIPWRPSLWDAVVEAQATDRPIFLWAMNGHPLACT